jgi:Dienelactone hydrolase family
VALRQPRDRSQQSLGIGMARHLEHILSCAAFDDLPGIEYGHLIGDLPRLCVMNNIDRPRFACRSRNRSRICASTVTSSAVVGSSRIRKSGSADSVRLPRIARCCSSVSARPLADNARPADVKIPLQGHFAARDYWCLPEQVDAFEAGLKACGNATSEIYRYDADHGFANEQRNHHDRKNSELAWGRMLDFWQRYL